MSAQDGVREAHREPQPGPGHVPGGGGGGPGPAADRGDERRAAAAAAPGRGHDAPGRPAEGPHLLRLRQPGAAAQDQCGESAEHL